MMKNHDCTGRTRSVGAGLPANGSRTAVPRSFAAEGRSHLQYQPECVALPEQAT